MHTLHSSYNSSFPPLCWYCHVFLSKTVKNTTKMLPRVHSPDPLPFLLNLSVLLLFYQRQFFPVCLHVSFEVCALHPELGEGEVGVCNNCHLTSVFKSYTTAMLHVKKIYPFHVVPLPATNRRINLQGIFLFWSLPVTFYKQKKPSLGSFRYSGFTVLGNNKKRAKMHISVERCT